MDKYKAGDVVKYKIPVFICTKCENAQFFDPAAEFLASAQFGDFSHKTIKRCDNCDNDEFVLSEFSAEVGVPAKNITR